MPQSFAYLLIDFFAVVICFIASFHRKLRFDRHFGTFLCSSAVVSVPYIAWDVWFTRLGVWHFDVNYTLGIIIAGMPLEEWLFFWCIPFSCVFTYYCLDNLFNLQWASIFNNIIVFTSVIVLAVGALLYVDKMYSFITTLVTLFTLVYLHFIVKKEWIGQASIVYLILMPGFLVVNGILTGTGISSPIVNYNPDECLGIRILTIPVEDFVYGYSLFLLHIYFFDLFKKTFQFSRLR